MTNVRLQVPKHLFG